MRYKLVITAEAHEEEADAYNYYESILPGLGDDLLDILNRHYQKLQENPFYFSFISTSKILRDVKIERFPYLIVYFVSNDTVFVLSVRNTYRKPFA